MSKFYLAIDIGATSGRHIVGWEQDGKIMTDEVYRFPNGVEPCDGHLVWNIDGLFERVREGIRNAFAKYPSIESLSIDTWGVDYVLMSKDERIDPVYSYRDGRTEQPIKEVHEIIPFAELYAKTGIQFQPFNTVYQLYCDKQNGRLDTATDFLMIPEYLSYMLTGVKYHEYTNATTGALINTKTLDYDKDIISRLGLPEKLFCKPVAPGAKIGALKSDIAAYVGGNLAVVACASHDTASAVHAIPIEGDNPYISSGTWSLLGAKIPHAITTSESCEANYSNEGGVGYIRYLKNIMGMWIVNNLRKELAPDSTPDGAMEMAMKSDFEGFVDVTDSRFLAPESMKAAFDSCFDAKNAPKTAGDYFKCARTSLALGYKNALEGLSKLTGTKYERLYIVGGGARDTYLNDLTREICGIEVVALPIEATAIGNLKIQMEADK